MAGHYNLQIRRGADFGFVVDYTDENDLQIDLRGFDVMLQMRRQRHPKSKLLAEFSTENGRITLLRPQFGEMIIGMDGESTFALPVGDWYYDLVVYQHRPVPRQNNAEDEYISHRERYTVPVLSGMVTVIDTAINFEDMSCE